MAVSWVMSLVCAFRVFFLDLDMLTHFHVSFCFSSFLSSFRFASRVQIIVGLVNLSYIMLLHSYDTGTLITRLPSKRRIKE